MLHNLPPYQQLPHHQSQGNVSDGNVSDTVSESSDNATLMSLSLSDLTALGAGQLREDIRVNRKKLESLIIRERDDPQQQEKSYMDKLMETTNTYIQWPSRMKIGAKTKKDLYVRIYGHNPDDVNDAKAKILADLGPHRDLRITLKMEISYTDHSHLIGCRGATIRRVMDDTGCHIHFPDSNRMSKDHKSNQVTIAGSSVQAVEQARARVRELSPLLFQFTLPMMNTSYDGNPDAHHVFIENIQSNYNVQVTIHPPNKLQQTACTVKGCEVDAPKIKEAIAKIVRYFSGGTLAASQNTTVDLTMEISAPQHSFVRAVNDTNIHAIMMNTGAKIVFPDLSDSNIQQIKRSRVYVSGEINCVYNARQQLIGCLPLRMIFDVADDFHLDWDVLRTIGHELNVQIRPTNRNRTSSDRGGLGAASLPPVPGRGRTVQLIAAERNTANIYEARRRILGSTEVPVSVSVPATYALRPIPNGHRHSIQPQQLPPLMVPPSPNMLSPVLSPSFWPPHPFGSPFCSPPISSCVLSSGSGGSCSTASMSLDAPPPGLSKVPASSFSMNSGHSQHSSFGFNSNLSTPAGTTPEFSLATRNAMKQSMHLPLMTDQNMRAFPTPASTVSSEGSYPLNSLMQEFRDLDLKRRAPGWERSNTAPNLYARIGPGSSGGSIISEGSVSGDSLDNSMPSKVSTATSAMQDNKKYMALKAMYNSKVGPNPRVPTAEWSGFGFSRTHLSLFPQEPDNNNCATTSVGVDGGEAKIIHVDGKKTSSLAGWTDSEMAAAGSINNNNNDTKGVDSTTAAAGKPKEGAPKPPLVPQHSNLLDFSASRTSIDTKPATDLPTLFLENGLDKYVDIFMSEEIDLESFATLTEADLRALGVTSYHARKKMHLLIASLNCSQTDIKDIWEWE